MDLSVHFSGGHTPEWNCWVTWGFHVSPSSHSMLTSPPAARRRQLLRTFPALVTACHFYPCRPGGHTGVSGCGFALSCPSEYC